MGTTLANPTSVRLAPALSVATTAAASIAAAAASTAILTASCTRRRPPLRHARRVKADRLVRSMGGGGSLRCGRRWVCARPAEAGALLLEEHPRAPRHAGLAVPRGVPPGRLVQAVEALQKALLNDCDTRQKEVLLAVRWGEPLILQEQLEKGGSSPSGDPKEQGVVRRHALDP